MPVGQDGTQHATRQHATGRDAASPRAAGRIRAGAGENHARRAGAIGRALAGALGPLLLAAGLLAGGPRAASAQAFPPQAFPVQPFSPPAAAAPAAENPLVQRNVPAEATAENAVVARDRALASGQRIAYQRMAAATGLPAGASDQQIEAMVASLIIESERITPRGYSARITVNFNQPGGGGFAEAAPPPAAAGAAGPAVASLEAVARYRSFAEYVELSRRLGAAPAVARVEVITVAGDMARLRLGLRSPPGPAAAELAGSGLALGPAQDGRPGEGWRLGLAGGR